MNDDHLLSILYREHFERPFYRGIYIDSVHTAARFPLVLPKTYLTRKGPLMLYTDKGPGANVQTISPRIYKRTGKKLYTARSTIPQRHGLLPPVASKEHQKRQSPSPRKFEVLQKKVYTLCTTKSDKDLRTEDLKPSNSFMPSTDTFDSPYSKVERVVSLKDEGPSDEKSDMGGSKPKTLPSVSSLRQSILEYKDNSKKLGEAYWDVINSPRPLNLVLNKANIITRQQRTVMNKEQRQKPSALSCRNIYLAPVPLSYIKKVYTPANSPSRSRR